MSFITISCILLMSLSAVAGTITGKVIDSVTGSPVESASVALTNPPCSTITAADGSFTIKLPETRVVVPVKPREIPVASATTKIFDLSGRKLPERKVFPAGVLIAEGRKFLLIPGKSAPSFGMVKESKSAAMREIASAGEFTLNVAASGYQPASKEIDETGDIGEILLSPRVKVTICVALAPFGFLSINGGTQPTASPPEDSVGVSVLSGSYGPLVIESMVSVDGSDTVRASYWLEPEKKYTVLVSQENASHGLRGGSAIYDILEADTSVSIICKPDITPFSCFVDLENSVFASDAIGVKLKCSVVQTGGAAPYSFSLEKEFEIGTVDEVSLGDTLSTNYAWDLDLTILCEDTSYSANVRTPVLGRGEDYNLSLFPQETK